MGFPSLAAFVGYAVPIGQLLRQGVSVEPVFGGNQQGIMAQLKAGKVVAAVVNSLVSVPLPAAKIFTIACHGNPMASSIFR